jgi:hypothetical protein
LGQFYSQMVYFVPFGTIFGYLVYFSCL